MNKSELSNKVKMMMDRDLTDELIKLKKTGDSYSDVIWKLLKERKKK